jgi:hypothetical protein
MLSKMIGACALVCVLGQTGFALADSSAEQANGGFGAFMSSLGAAISAPPSGFKAGGQAGAAKVPSGLVTLPINVVIRQVKYPAGYHLGGDSRTQSSFHHISTTLT